MKPEVNIMWLRRDLRIKDNAALYHALKAERPVLVLFIFDKNILDDLEDKKDKRVQFIHDALLEIQQQLQKLKSTIEVQYGTPLEVFEKLSKEYNIEKVFANDDYGAIRYRP